MMTTEKNKLNGQAENEELITALYCRLSVEDMKDGRKSGEGTEMLPFYNIFNEWYAAQTSKKIRAIWQSKADNGKRVSAAIPYGYMKDPEDKEKWLIDEPAAEVVRKIFTLCLAGRVPLQIAKQLEQEQILIPSAYYESIGRKPGTLSLFKLQIRTWRMYRTPYSRCRT